MTRLKKLASESEEIDDFGLDDNGNDNDFEGIKKETLGLIEKMHSHTNEWAVRDILKQFTGWGFYNGEMMVSIDDTMAKDICEQLYNYVESLFRIDDVYEVYEEIYQFNRYK